MRWSDISAFCRQEVVAPVGSNDCRCLVVEMEHALQLCLIVFLELVAHEVTHVVGLCRHLIEVSVMLVVVHQIEKQRMLAEFIFRSCLPAPSLATHIIVGTSRNVGAGVRTVG